MISETLQLLDTEEGRHNPYPLYDRLREHPPVYDERHQAILIVRYADCAQALSGFGRPDEAWVKRRIPDWESHPAVVCLMRTMQFGDPESHPRRRGVVSRFFTKRRITSHIAAESATVDTLVDDLVAEIAAHGEADIQNVLSYRLPSISIARLLGLPEHEIAGLRPHSLALANLLEPQLSQPDLAAADQSLRELEVYFEQVIEARRRHPGDDLASHLVQVHEAGTLSWHELTSMFASIFVAGTMNTSNFIGNGVAALLSSPPVVAQLRAQPSLIQAAMTEMLRYDAPMQVTRRITVAATELGGTRLPAGAELAIVLGSANRDPAVYTEPDRFVPGRSGPPPLSFGGGSYFCIGAAMAREEGALIFSKLLSRLPELRAARTPTHNLRSVLRGYLHLPVTADVSLVGAGT
ncbi:cytochrome P450 [Kibdelosporangium banguiense]|uniref:Cytochrome P450 n=1 Tax=Kibdelosporangium banguiense TaxID=1365924 RepID=A0ABS4TQY0_9PSEU|nr:cytochrome P450 [Kibdelosporangium banguiense]MBP2326815.1 cytochrome P450 [Kibdelosporangium banguiense]